MIFQNPKLRDGCVFEAKHGAVVIRYKGIDFDFEFDDHDQIGPVMELLGLLDGTRDQGEVVARGGGLSEADVRTLLRLLDDNYLLTEGAVGRPGKSGLAFAAELEDLYFNSWMADDGETPLVTAVYEGKAERDVLIGWGIECFHVTSRAHDCLSPILSRFHGSQKHRAIDYFIDEYRHDKLIIKSLVDIGYRREDIENAVPLPYTQAVMNLLAKWANTDLLSFMGGLFVFEGTPEIGNAYIASLSQYDLPPEFVEGQSIHNDINNDGDHGNVTRDFFSTIEAVSLEDQRRVIRNLRLLYEAQRSKHDNVLRYYRAPTIGIPRLLARRPAPAGNVRQVA